MIDAAQYHDPRKAPALIESAIQSAGSQRAVAERCGLSREYLRQLAKGGGEMSYGVQVMLEGIIRQP